MNASPCDLFHNLGLAFALTGLLSLSIPLGLCAQDSTESQSETNAPCDSPEAHQFDFWIGDWDLTWEGGAGQNTITADYDGCVVRENFRADPDSSASSPLKGMSISVYIPSQKHWQQTWVDNLGSYMDFVGGFEDGKMTISREFTGQKGKNVRQRMVFYNISENSMDWNWENSIDGAEWKLAWKIHYQRR